jgi:hypothetical protein
VSESPTSTPDRPPFEPVEESVLTASIRDLPTSLDSLGFAPYVEAIAEFLTNENTKPPLTLSVEGDWDVWPLRASQVQLNVAKRVPGASLSYMQVIVWGI